MAAKLRFLVVDPLEGVQLFARRLLEGYGFEPDCIHCFGDSASALAFGLQQPPDFLLTDWFGKSRPTGLQLYQELRASHPGCRVGYLSFEVSAEIETAAKVAGSRFLLKKPFSAEELKRTLQQGFDWMAQRNPQLAARVSAESRGKLDARRRIELPPLPPPVRVGELLRYEGSQRKVLAVVISHGEQLAQLEGLKELVAAGKLSR